MTQAVLFFGHCTLTSEHSKKLMAAKDEPYFTNHFDVNIHFFIMLTIIFIV